MKIRVWHWVAGMAVVMATGCAGLKEYNLPPAQQLLEPGTRRGRPRTGSHPAGGRSRGAGRWIRRPGRSGLRADRSGAVPQAGRDAGPVGCRRSRPVRLDAAGRPRPAELPAGRHLSAEDHEHPGPRRRGTLSRRSKSARRRRGREAFLAHNAIPVQFTEEDFDQVLTGNFVTKVIYLPDPEFQELALAGVETLVSTRLGSGRRPDRRSRSSRRDPGGDPPRQQGHRNAGLERRRHAAAWLHAGRRSCGPAVRTGRHGPAGHCRTTCRA